MQNYSNLEPVISEYEGKQEGVSALLDAILAELEEVEGQVSMLSENGKTLTHTRINKIKALINVSKEYNDK